MQKEFREYISTTEKKDNIPKIFGICIWVKYSNMRNITDDTYSHIGRINAIINCLKLPRLMLNLTPIIFYNNVKVNSRNEIR